MMERSKIDLLFICGVVNSKYLSGFFHNGGDHDGTVGARPFSVMFFRDPSKAPALLVPAVDLHLAKDSSWIGDVRGYIAAELYTDLRDPIYPDVFAAATAVLADRKALVETVGLEESQLTVALAQRLRSFFEKQRVVDISSDMGLVRMVKTPEEIRRIRRAIDITTKAHETFRAAARPGVTDRDLYRATATRMIEEGAEEAKFIFPGMGPTRYAANARFLTGYPLKLGDFLRVDMGASYLGYGADFVRSYVLGEPTKTQRDAWKHLVDVELELGHSIHVGEKGGEIYARGVRMIEKYLPRFPREFVGHGIGLVFNEQPRMNAGNGVPIEPDTVYCAELSYYLEDGVRLHVEDMFLLTDSGIEMLTRACPHDLAIPV
jgi:Xaa-Pro aminopeptidase/Xaa-Pro dipeptidase